MSVTISRSSKGRMLGIPNNATDISREFKEFADTWFKKGGVLYISEIYVYFRKHFPQYRQKKDLGDFFIDQALMNWNEKYGHAETKFTGMLIGIQIDRERVASVQEEEQLKSSRAKDQDIINQIFASVNRKSFLRKNTTESQLQKLDKAESMKMNESVRQAKTIEEIEKIEEEEKRRFKARMKSLQTRKEIEKKKNLEIQKQLRKLNQLRDQITGSSSHKDVNNLKESSSHTSRLSIRSKGSKTSKDDIENLLVSVRSCGSVMTRGTVHSAATDSYASFADAENDPLFGNIEGAPLSIKKKKKKTARKNSMTSSDSTAPISEEEDKPVKLKKTKSAPAKLRKTKSISKVKKSKSIPKNSSRTNATLQIETGKAISKIKKKSVRKLNTTIDTSIDQKESKTISKRSSKVIDPQNLSLLLKTKKGSTEVDKIKPSNKGGKIKTVKKKNILCADDSKTNIPMKKIIKKKKMIYQ